MNIETCTVLASVYPLVLVAVVADRRLIHARLRRTKLYRWMFMTTLTACLIGLAFSVVGVQVGGYSNAQGMPLWIVAAAALAAFSLSILMNAATAENDEDALDVPMSAQ